jgi:hypothetical protein
MIYWLSLFFPFKDAQPIVATQGLDFAIVSDKLGKTISGRGLFTSSLKVKITLLKLAYGDKRMLKTIKT